MKRLLRRVGERTAYGIEAVAVFRYQSGREEMNPDVNAQSNDNA